MDGEITEQRLKSSDVVAMVTLFLATVAVVLWQNSRLTILWDVSYILENATRIAAGDVPYRDFPFPYAPLTFVLQALIIKLFGRVYWHHIAYAAIAGGAASALTYAFVRRLVGSPLAAFLFTAPLAILGIYCIVPNPFYDPDSCLLILLLLFLLAARRRLTVLTGAACVLTLFVKQNIGLAFGAAIGASLLLLLALERERRYLHVLAGMVGGAMAGVAIVAAIFGLGDYVHWTIRFAAARRLPPLSQQLAIYADATLWRWVAAVLFGALITHRVRGVLGRALGLVLMAFPSLWILVDFFVHRDAEARQIQLLRLWPMALILTLPMALVAIRRERGFLRLLPLIVAATVHGVFLSQSTWGSTYGIWPLLIVLLAFGLRTLALPSRDSIVLAALVALAMLLSGWDYIANNDRLTYAKVAVDTDGDNVGPMERSGLHALAGLHMRGHWLSDFEELVEWTDRNIPRQDAILSLPGEDLFYFTTGRRPRFPVLMFDHTVNPYDAATIAQLAEARKVRWVIVKKELQLNGVPFEELPDTVRLLGTHFAPAAHLSNYDIYHRRSRSKEMAELAAHPTGNRGSSRSASATASSKPSL